LLLALWDAPRLPDRTAGGASREHSSQQIDSACETIPHSLRPDPSPSSYALLGELGVASLEEGRIFNGADNTKVAATQHLPPIETGLGEGSSNG